MSKFPNVIALDGLYDRLIDERLSADLASLIQANQASVDALPAAHLLGAALGLDIEEQHPRYPAGPRGRLWRCSKISFRCFSSGNCKSSSPCFSGGC